MLYVKEHQTRNPTDSEHLLSDKHIPAELHKYSNDPSFYECVVIIIFKLAAIKPVVSNVNSN